MRSKLKRPCPTCNGKGVVSRPVGKTVDGIEHAQATAHLWPAICERCNGTGLVPDLGPNAENPPS